MKIAAQRVEARRRPERPQTFCRNTVPTQKDQHAAAAMWSLQQNSGRRALPIRLRTISADRAASMPKTMFTVCFLAALIAAYAAYLAFNGIDPSKG
ncbi:MAG: hypothetical protein WB760_14295 [Xanthobacteraceae bacterium]